MTEGRNKGGRPPIAKAGKRSEEIKFHVTPDVKRRLQDEAKAAGVDLATYCREKVLTGRPPRRIPPEVLAAIAELARQGNNLNQLTVMARQGRITQVNYEPFTEVYRNAWQTLNSLLSHAV